MRHTTSKLLQNQAGLTLVELMVALAIGSFLIIGTVQIYNQSRLAFVVNESVARVQETAHFAMDTIESDLRMASNWGRNSRSLAVEGRAVVGDPDPTGLQPPADCGDAWALDLALPIDGVNNDYTLSCAATGGVQANSDVVTIRRASVQSVAPQAGRLQLQTTRIQGQLFKDGVIPNAFSPADSETHNLMVSSYYVAPTSDLIPGVPTLRRKVLTTRNGAPVIEDQEIAPGVENLQLQLGIDLDDDNTVDRYVNPGDDVYIPGTANYVPGARVMTARVWIVVRSVGIEPGHQNTRAFVPGDVSLGTPNDSRRRMQLSKTILLRNSRT